MNCNDNVLTTQREDSIINLKDEVLKMTTTLQIRIDEDLKKQATKVYEELGMDLSTAIRIFLKRSVMTHGMPFNLIIDEAGIKAMQAMDEMSRISAENGNDKMTLEEINKEIEEARKEIKKRRNG